MHAGEATLAFPCARSSGDRARASGARGRRFDSCRAHRVAERLRGRLRTCPCCRPSTPSVQVPSLPRIRTRRAGPPPHAVDVAPRPRLAELQSEGLTWLHLEAPSHEEAQLLAARFGWHPLDVEDVLSRRERPKVDSYTEEESAGYLFAVLHFPVYNAAVGRLDAGELDVFLGPDYLVTLPNVELKPVTRLFERCYDERGVPAQPLQARLGPAALRAARRPLRLLLPDPRQDRPEAAADRRGDRRDHAAREGARARHPQGEAGDHLVPQDRAAAASDAAPARAADRALPARGARALLRRHRRRERAHLGQPRQLQGSRRGARGHERVAHLTPAERHPVRAHDLQRRDAAADVHHRASSG